MAWLQDSWDRLMQRMTGGRLPHALLVTGEHGVGKRLFANALAGLLVCDRPDRAGGAPCGRCKQCELVSAGTHPDIRVYAPEKSRMIKIDQIRALSSFAVGSPQVATRKVAIIDRADQLNINSANALLKTLEEPADDVTLVLLQESGRPVLPTIRSRCQSLLIATPGKDQAAHWLAATVEKLDSDSRPTPEQCQKALGLSANAPRLALEYATGDFITVRDEALENFRRFMKGQLSVAEAAKPFKAMGLESALWLFEGWAGDLARIGAGSHPRDEDAAEMLTFLATHNPPWRAHEILDAIHEARSAGVYNVNPEFEAGRLLMAWQKLMPVRRPAAG
ncbi:DNA polymerase III subunit delta' [Marinobacter orientalis]|uniref:DNA-directed DNA polymerase n=1 Tax=Marinobacter orientalis TaxID=1928859 RepID=A0A7Y0WSE0_9GAMM|nr:DNA polymerase III subunit delta' [Marinobacter orientalis]NMT63745.1 DNA polymerase III subunit delta' [Marinobacter orientalis]TGX50086.1 DNA polymerase III subunit delta' [Marinobacter orientalis]